MSKPFTGSIIGSWRFTQNPPHSYDDSETIYHFDVQGTNHWELSLSLDGPRVLVPLRYSYANSTLHFKYGNSWHHETRLVDVENGEIQAVDVARGLCWCMKRLEWPLSYSVAFVNDEGLLVKSLQIP